MTTTKHKPTKGEKRLLRADEFVGVIRSTAQSIGGSNTPTVTCKGEGFKCAARWTLRFFIKEMCSWAKAHVGAIPTLTEIEQWCDAAWDQAYRVEAGIFIPTPPERLPVRINMALTGGTIHEELHYLYSCQRMLKPKVMYDLIVPRWALVPDWSQYTGLLLEYSNLFEDTRIERNGCVEFPGIPVKLADLADYIIDMEAKSRLEAMAAGIDVSNARNVIACTMRDLGLGYVTDKTKNALLTYRRLNDDAVDMVIGGPLRPILDRSRSVGISVENNDDLECLPLAMDMIVVLKQEGQDQSPDGSGNGDGEGEGNDDQPGDQPGPGQKVACPKCKAPAKKLRLHKHPSKTDHAVITCTVCGYQQEIDLTEQPQGGGEGESDSIPSDIFDEDQPDQPGGGKGDSDGDSGDDSSDDQTGGGSSDQEGDEEGDDQGGAGSDDGDEEGDDAEGSDDSDGGDSDGDSSDDTGDSEGKGDKPSKGDRKVKEQSAEGHEYGDNADQPSSDQSSDQVGPEGGGHNYEKDPKEYKPVADDVLKDGDSEGLKGATEQLGEDITDQADKEDGSNEDVQEGEAPWRPLNPHLDEHRVVRCSSKGKEHDRREANKISKRVRRISHYLRARLRNIVQAQEIVSTLHGVPKGRGLSMQFLVDSHATLKGGKMPGKAYYDQDAEQDTSLSAAIVLDQSSSMESNHEAARAALSAIVEPLDALGGKTLAVGFRNGTYSNDPTGERYHRASGVVIDIFKRFEERFSAVKFRFANTLATGSTPMADGIQFALDALSERPEGHRLLIVITDGAPDGNHRPVVNRQIRQAAEAGIYVLGVGIGHGAGYLARLFPHYCFGDTIDDLPKPIVKKLTELFDPACRKRGRKVKKTA